MIIESYTEHEELVDLQWRHHPIEYGKYAFFLLNPLYETKDWILNDFSLLLSISTEISYKKSTERLHVFLIQIVAVEIMAYSLVFALNLYSVAVSSIF